MIAGVFICWALVNDPGGQDAKKGGEDGPDLSIFIGILMVPLVLAAIALILALIPVAVAIALVVLALIAVWWLLSRFIRFLHRKASERAQRDDATEVQTNERESRSSWTARIREKVGTATASVRRVVRRDKSESVSEGSEREESRSDSVNATRAQSREHSDESAPNQSGQHSEDSIRERKRFRFPFVLVLGARDRKRAKEKEEHIRPHASESIASERRDSTRQSADVAGEKTSFRFSSALVRGAQEKRGAEKEKTRSRSDRHDEVSKRKRGVFHFFAARENADEQASFSPNRDASVGTRKASPLQRLARAWGAVREAVRPRTEQRLPRERRSQVHAALNLAADLEGNAGVARTLAQVGPVDVSTQLRRIGWFTRMRMHRLRPH